MKTVKSRVIHGQTYQVGDFIKPHKSWVTSACKDFGFRNNETKFEIIKLTSMFCQIRIGNVKHGLSLFDRHVSKR